MAAALLRPELPVIARTVSPADRGPDAAPSARRSVVNPFDRFGDHLRLALRAPASYQLLTWLEGGPGAELPERGRPPTDGPMGAVRVRPVRPGAGRRPAGRGPGGDDHRAGRERRPGPATSSSATPPNPRCWPGPTWRAPSASSPAPTTTPPTCRCWPAARRINPDLFLAARQNHAGQRAAVRGDAAGRAAGADRGGRARGVRPAQHAAAVAVHPGDAGAGRRLGGGADQADHRELRSRACRSCGRSG